MSFRQNNRIIKNLPSFRYGLNTQKEADEIADEEIADCENYTIEDDVIKSAQGYVQWDNAVNAGPYWGIFQFKKSDGAQVLIRQRQGYLEYDSDDNGTWILCTLPITGSPAMPITLSQCPCTFAQLNEICVFTNGEESVLQSSDGITWTNLAHPKSKVVFNNGANRLIFLGQTGTGRQFRIDWTDINDPTTISATAYQLIDPNKSAKVMGAAMTPNGTNLIFTESSIYEISDYTTDGALDVNFIGSAHLASHQSIATTEDSVIFGGIDGIYEFIGGTIRLISGQIDWSGRNNSTRTDLWCGVYYNGKYHLSLPDLDVSTTYNSQEYIVHKRIQRPDAVQPFSITRNRRYFGCYGIEDFDSITRDRIVSVYAGDSRPSTSGSPATTNYLFCFINDFRDESYPSGLNGAAQSCSLVTKFYTDNIPYYAKKFKKLFITLNLQNESTFTFSYRFLPYGSWFDVNKTYSTEELNFTLEDGNEGGFSEGFGFFLATQANDFIDIENTDRPRGIQFKISSNQINDVTILGLAFQYIAKPKFR
jgi:hypothetical protein